MLGLNCVELLSQFSKAEDFKSSGKGEEAELIRLAVDGRFGTSGGERGAEEEEKEESFALVLEYRRLGASEGMMGRNPLESKRVPLAYDGCGRMLRDDLEPDLVEEDFEDTRLIWSPTDVGEVGLPGGEEAAAGVSEAEAAATLSAYRLRLATKDQNIGRKPRLSTGSLGADWSKEEAEVDRSDDANEGEET